MFCDIGPALRFTSSKLRLALERRSRTALRDVPCRKPAKGR
jgi:hypothetical protein